MALLKNRIRVRPLQILDPTRRTGSATLLLPSSSAFNWMNRDFWSSSVRAKNILLVMCYDFNPSGKRGGGSDMTRQTILMAITLNLIIRNTSEFSRMVTYIVYYQARILYSAAVTEILS